MQADVVVESAQYYQKWLADAASREPSVAPNQAATEYALREEKEDKAAWATVVPAPAPVVNYHP